MERNKIYCQICKTHNSEFHCPRCVNKTYNLYKSEIHQYELNMKKIIDNVKKLEKKNKPLNNIRNNLENYINEYAIQIQEKQLIIQKKQEDINNKRKELELRKQKLLKLNEKLNLKQENFIKNSLSSDKTLEKNDTNETKKQSNENIYTNDTNKDVNTIETNENSNNGNNTNNNEDSNENSNSNNNSNKEKENNFANNDCNKNNDNKINENNNEDNNDNSNEIDYNIFMDSDNVKKLINNTYLKTYEQLNNQLMRARQILIRELSKIFKLQKITGLQHGGNNLNSYNNTNIIAPIPSSNNISSFLNSSISQVLHDTPISKIFGISETESGLNNSIYNNPNFDLYEDITIADIYGDYNNKIKHSQSSLSRESSNQSISKTLPPRIKNSYLYNRNVMSNQSNYKHAKKKGQNISETYTILGYLFPPINEIWNYTHEYINTSLEYIIHYVILLSYYLDVKLPFSLHYQGVRSYVECHLYDCTCYLPLCYSEKTIEEFLTGLSMLCYDIIYLCYTQGVIVKNENLLNILENIYKCTKSPFLGQTLNSDIEFHKHNVNFSMLPNSYYHTTKQKIQQKRPFNSEAFKRKVPYELLNNTLANSYNLRFSEIVKLVFLHANIQIPINNNHSQLNNINDMTTTATTTTTNNNYNTDNNTNTNNNNNNNNNNNKNINQTGITTPPSFIDDNNFREHGNPHDMKYRQSSSIEWNDLSCNIETMTLSDDDKNYNTNVSPKMPRDKNIELLNNAKKKLKFIQSINNIIHTDKKSNSSSTSNFANENNSSAPLNLNNNNLNYLSNTNIMNDDSLIDDPSKNNNIFDYENMMGSEEQIRKQRLTEFLNCVFHDYFSTNTNQNEWVLINQ